MLDEGHTKPWFCSSKVCLSACGPKPDSDWNEHTAINSQDASVAVMANQSTLQIVEYDVEDNDRFQSGDIVYLRTKENPAKVTVSFNGNVALFRFYDRRPLFGFKGLRIVMRNHSSWDEIFYGPVIFDQLALSHDGTTIAIAHENNLTLYTIEASRG